MKIRPVAENDCGKMLEIYSPYILQSSISFETEVPELDEFKSRVKEYTDKFPWLVCEVDDSVVGYAYASAHRSRCAYEWSVESTVYVAKEHQGKGIGKKLYGELFRLLEKQGAVNVFAGITQPNEGSVRLHEAMGFVPIGKFKDIGFKLNQWWDVGWWQLQLKKPARPHSLLSPREVL